MGHLIVFLLLLVLAIHASCQYLKEEEARGSSDGSEISLRRVKRQSAPDPINGPFPTVYYLCGTYPNIYYSRTACQMCSNGGVDLMIGCTTPAQCVAYNRGGSITSCIYGRCCSVPSNGPTNPYSPYVGVAPPPSYVPNSAGYYSGSPYSPYNPYLYGPPPPPGVFSPQPGGGQQQYLDPYGGGQYQLEKGYGLCPGGDASNIRCSAPGQCPLGRVCLNGLCCISGPMDYRQACGGQPSTQACQGGFCSDGFVCTASNYCCQCPVGRSGGRCNAGQCSPGFRCTLNGYCCASCPGNASPFGACPDQQNALCTGGSQCSIGDMCCLFSGTNNNY